MKKKNAAAETTHTAADNAAAVLADTKDKIAPLIDQGKEKLGPLATEARAKGSAYAQQAAEAVGPAVAAARGAARTRYDDMLPRLTDALENLANNPNVQEAEARGLAAVKALRGDLQLSKKDRKRLHNESLAQIQALRETGSAPQKKKKKSKLVTLLIFGAIGGLVFIAWKKLFGAQETDWQTHTASAYQPSGAADAPQASQSFAEPVDVPEESGTAGAAAAGTAAAGAATADEPKYGDGAYVGAEPPEGYTIKGNERSMKYHTPETGGYERTIADVWFNSETAAEAAGFSKAQR